MSEFDNLILPDDTAIGTERVEPVHEEKKSIGITDTVSNIFKRRNYLYTSTQYIQDKLVNSKDYCLSSLH